VVEPRFLSRYNVRMFHLISRLTAALVLSLLFVQSLANASTNDHVVLITVDGFPAYIFTDPQAPLPTFRKLAREGAVAEGMKVSNPAITWPNHTTLVTGMQVDRHSVFFNGVLVKPGSGLPVRVDPRRDKNDLVAVPTIYDHLHKAAYTTAGVNWPCTRNAPTLHDNFPDVPDQVTHTTPRLRIELVKAGILSDETDRSFTAQSAASKDQIWTAAAVHVIKQRKPNLLLFHMLITDSTHHRYGPQSPASYTALAQADAQLRDILLALDEAGIRERTTLFVTSDHGFAIATNLLNPNVLFRKAGLLEVTNAQIARARAQIVAEGGTAMLYLTRPETAAEDRAKVLSLLQNAEGIAEIITGRISQALVSPILRRTGKWPICFSWRRTVTLSGTRRAATIT
jgi:predicted AlkP superfamily pyrophosphatase or phosphodiesterase